MIRMLGSTDRHLATPAPPGAASAIAEAVLDGPRRYHLGQAAAVAGGGSGPHAWQKQRESRARAASSHPANSVFSCFPAWSRPIGPGLQHDAVQRSGPEHLLDERQAVLLHIRRGGAQRVG